VVPTGHPGPLSARMPGLAVITVGKLRSGRDLVISARDPPCQEACQLTSHRSPPVRSLFPEPMHRLGPCAPARRGH